MIKAKPIAFAVVLGISGSLVPEPAYAGCGWYRACLACVSRAISNAQSRSTAAFNELDASIINLGRVFRAGLRDTSVAIEENGAGLAAALIATSKSTTAQTQVGTKANTSMWEELNRQQEGRLQQLATLEENFYLQENYRPDSLPRSVMLAFASQNDIALSEYAQFSNDHHDAFYELMKTPRDDLLNKVLVTEEIQTAEPLLWEGEITTADDAAKVAVLTQQLLFGEEGKPFVDVQNIETVLQEGGRDSVAVMSEKVTWRSRVMPVMDFFAFDQGLRTRPDENSDSFMHWLEENISDSLDNPEGVIGQYADASEKDLMLALAVEVKKRNVLKMLSFKASQLENRIMAVQSGVDFSKEQTILRKATKLTDFQGIGE